MSLLNNNILPLTGFYCQKVLPLTYDNSLSYYEQLCKITHKINEVIQLINGDITQSLKDYIDEHFNELMINASYDANTKTIFFTKGAGK